MAQELRALRRKGVLILGSGNLVHNLKMLDWQHPDGGYDWAMEMNDRFKKQIMKQEHGKLIDYQDLGPVARLSIPTPEHYLPIIYTLGISDHSDDISFFNDKTVMGSVSMTSLIAGSGKS